MKVSICYHNKSCLIYTLLTQSRKFILEISIYNTIARPKIPKIPTRLAPNAPLRLAALLGVEVALGAELVAELSAAAFSDTDSAEVALAAAADVADLEEAVVLAADVSEITSVSTAAAAWARPPKPEYVCK